MTDVEKLLAIEEIRMLKARYFRALDARDLEAYANVFTDDAEIDVRGSVTSDDDDEAALDEFDENAVIIGGKAMAEFVKKVASHITTAHHGHNAEIEILSDTEAKGIWAFEDHLWFPEDDPNRLMQGWGHYHETYRKVGGEWRIASMLITRIKVDMFPRD